MATIPGECRRGIEAGRRSMTLRARRHTPRTVTEPTEDGSSQSWPATATGPCGLGRHGRVPDRPCRTPPGARRADVINPGLSCRDRT